MHIAECLRHRSGLAAAVVRGSTKSVVRPVAACESGIARAARFSAPSGWSARCDPTASARADVEGPSCRGEISEWLECKRSLGRIAVTLLIAVMLSSCAAAHASVRADEWHADRHVGAVGAMRWEGGESARAVGRVPHEVVARRTSTKLVRAVGTGYASWYGRAHQGRLTASGEVYDMRKLTAAHPTLPMGTRVRVTNLRNGRSVAVRVNDRGPTVDGRIIDLSYAAAQQIQAVGDGVVPVRLDVVARPTQ